MTQKFNEKFIVYCYYWEFKTKGGKLNKFEFLSMLYQKKSQNMEPLHNT